MTKMYFFPRLQRLAECNRSVTGMVFPCSADGCLLVLVCSCDLPFQCLTLCSNLLSCKDRGIGLWPESFKWPYFTLTASLKLYLKRTHSELKGLRLNMYIYGRQNSFHDNVHIPSHCLAFTPGNLHTLFLGLAFKSFISGRTLIHQWPLYTNFRHKPQLRWRFEITISHIL